MLRNPGILIVVLGSRLLGQSAFDLHGYIQGRFTDQPGTSERLEIRRARIIVSGEPVSRLSYRFQVDGAKQPYLMDAWIAIKASRAMSVTVGQMKIPFSAESLVGDDQNPPVSRSRVVLALSPGRDTGVQARDVGVQASGSIGHIGRSLDYAAAVFRGQTFVLAPKVHYQATAGRIVAHLPGGLAIGGDWYGSFNAIGGLPKRREELEGWYVRGRGSIRAEQIWARDGQLPRRGGYVLGAWRLSKTWEALARSDWLTTDARKANTSSVAHVAGANLFLSEHVKIGCDAGAQAGPKPGVWASVFVAQVMLSF